MKKMLKFIITIMLIVGISMTTPAYAAQTTSGHKIPNDPYGRMCNNTYKEYIERGVVSGHMLLGHRLTNGALCTPTRLICVHQVECTACHYIFENYFPSECTEAHSHCGTRLMKHPSL